MRELHRRPPPIFRSKLLRESREVEAMAREIRQAFAPRVVLIPFGIEQDPDLIPQQEGVTLQ